jgi:hypothetical protein
MIETWLPSVMDGYCDAEWAVLLSHSRVKRAWHIVGLCLCSIHRLALTRSWFKQHPNLFPPQTCFFPCFYNWLNGLCLYVYPFSLSLSISLCTPTWLVCLGLTTASAFGRTNILFSHTNTASHTDWEHTMHTYLPHTPTSQDTPGDSRGTATICLFTLVFSSFSPPSPNHSFHKTLLWVKNDESDSQRIPLTTPSAWCTLKIKKRCKLEPNQVFESNAIGEPL